MAYVINAAPNVHVRVAKPPSGLHWPVRPKRGKHGSQDEFITSVSPQEYEAFCSIPEIPVFFGTEVYGSRAYWGYQGCIYTTQEDDLTPDDVAALLGEKENKKRLRLQKAHSLRAMADQLETGKRRESIPRAIKLGVWQRDQGQCTACGSNRDLEFDHIIPLAIGGSNTERNLQLLCAECNRRKGATLGGEGSLSTASPANPAGATDSLAQPEPPRVESPPSRPEPRLVLCQSCQRRNKVAETVKRASCGSCGEPILGS